MSSAIDKLEALDQDAEYDGTWRRAAIRAFRELEQGTQEAKGVATVLDTKPAEPQDPVETFRRSAGVARDLGAKRFVYGHGLFEIEFDPAESIREAAQSLVDLLGSLTQPGASAEYIQPVATEPATSEPGAPGEPVATEPAVAAEPEPFSPAAPATVEPVATVEPTAPQRAVSAEPAAPPPETPAAATPTAPSADPATP